MKYIPPFGKYLKDLRLARRLTLKELGSAIKVSGAYISAIELGIKNPTDQFIEKIVEFFCIEATERDYIIHLASLSKRKLIIDLSTIEDDLIRDSVVNFCVQVPSLTREKALKIMSIIYDKEKQ